MKKFLCICSFMICAALSISTVIPTGVFADNDLVGVSSGNEYGELGEKAEILNKLGIARLSGDLAEGITRGYYINIIGNILWQGTEPTYEPCFDDVTADSEYESAISCAYKLGIISGGGDNKFEPERYITLNEALTVMVKVLGYDIMADKNSDLYSQVNSIAAKIGLSRDIASIGSGDLKVVDTILILYNALEIPILNRISYTKSDSDNVYSSKIEKDKDKNLLTEYMKIYKYEGVVSADYYTNIYNDTDDGLKESQIKIDNIICNAEQSGLLGKSVAAYLRKVYNKDEYEIVYISESNFSKTVELNGDDILPSVNIKTIQMENENGKKQNYNISDNAAVIYNGKFLGRTNTSDVSDDDFKINDGTIELTDNDGDNRYDVVKIFEYERIYIKRINETEREITDYYTDKKYSLDDVQKKTEIYKNGSKVTFDSIKNGQTAEIVESRDGKVVFVCLSDSSVSGSVSRTEKDEVVIDDKLYKLSKFYVDLSDSGNGRVTKLKPGVKGTFYIGGDGKIVAYKNSENTYYGYLVGFSDTDMFNDSAKARIYTANGEMADFDLAEKVKVINGNKETGRGVEYAVSNVEPRQAVIIETDSDNRLISLKTAVDSAASQTDAFVRNAAKSKMIYNLGILNARYRIGDNTMVMTVPDPETVSDIYDENYYRISAKFSNGNRYSAEVFDMDSVHDVGFVIFYTDSPTDELATRYGSDMIVNEYIDSLNEKSGETVRELTGFCDKKEVSMAVDDTDILPDSTYSAWKNLNIKAGDLKFGDVIQYNTLKTGNLGMYRVLFRPDKNAEYKEAWTSANQITENSIYADLYTAYGEVVSIGQKQIVFKSETNVEKVSSITSLTDIYIADMDKKKIRVGEYSDISEGDNVFLIITADGTKDIFIYKY